VALAETEAMPWVKLTDDWYDNPKFQPVSGLGRLLWVYGLTWSCRNMRDGFVSYQAVRQLSVDLGVDGSVLAGELVEAGLWHEADGGYTIHGYLDFNRSREDIIAGRRKDADRKSTRAMAAVAAQTLPWRPAP